MKENRIVTKKEVPSKALLRAMASSPGEKSSRASKVAIVLIHPHITNFFPKFRWGYMCQFNPLNYFLK